MAKILAVALGCISLVAACTQNTAISGIAFTETDLVDAFERYCLNPDGDYEWTWSLATHDGFVALKPEDYGRLRLPGARRLRAATRHQGGKEIRVVTAVNRVRLGQEKTYFHLCWVAADPMERRSVDRAVDRFLGVDRYREEDAYIYPWFPQIDETRQSVPRYLFFTRTFNLAREQGMRLVFTNRYISQTSITYMTPVESCDDWCY